MLNIRIEKATTLKEKPDPNQLGFGNIFTDHMFIMDYEEGKGWIDPRIVPYQDVVLAPSAMVFHYGQEMFEGLKAYRTKSDEILLFRPEMNIKRTNTTNQRICIPQVNEADVLQAIKAIVEVDKDWVPSLPGTSLYIRPFIIATDPFLGVRPANMYKLMIILSPVGAYYKEGMNPVKIWVETEYVRAVKGGVGFAKTGANYAASLKAQMKAKEKGYTQVLWLDGVERKYIEEVGTMNVFFKIDGEIITPSLEGSILPGVTRDSVIQLLKDWNMKVSERKLSIDDLYLAHEEGRLEEVFGTGTAAVISPVGLLDWDGRQLTVNNGEIGPVARKLYDTITGVQCGTIEDTYNWTVKVNQ
ncbi:branched-chain amino acid aminotransferase [Petrocella atlantisensis]|uniref:Branched-chain-amino-acid aminotransferase n=1 Tax=Petrocella atlantisensis TaxID=2173034 RepID=A0A3P7PIL7_9FIRM|nr:branched-chain amino acid aminotransferase [Petrocella atlantisensis]PKM56190.1 MAG: branched chain amino acid aminotransferase [Firmicutes bacterium HGW-Firmicutes-5]VDN48778.1 branched-chain amino acid aminotransferase [Petrocella atlantisensis]